MKKSFLIVLILILFITGNSIKVEAQYNTTMEDALIMILYPNITEEISKYYGYLKSFDLYDAKIVKLSRHEGTSFIVTILVQTYEGPHNPPYGKDTLTFEISVYGVKALEFKHEGDQTEKKVETFYNEVISDIIKSFNLDISKYKKYSFDQLNYLAYKDEKYKTLDMINQNIVFNILKDESKPPLKNVIEPVTYLKDDEGFIIFKRADGTNNLYKIQYLDETWNIIDKQTKNGKKMKKELIWYM